MIRWRLVTTFGILASMLNRNWALVFLLAVGFPALGQDFRDASALKRAIGSAFTGQQGAAVVLRVRDAKVLATHNVLTLSRRLATPGSTIKPFTLYVLLENHLLTSTDRIACQRNLTIKGVRLNCSHPEGLGPFDADEALAFSCNSYFTEVAKRLQPGQLESYLGLIGFDRVTGLLRDEGEGRIETANTMPERQLLAIGAAGVEVTPLELALAYTRIARWKASPTPPEKVVLEGLDAATDYGIAQNAQPRSIRVAGKTGTASNPGSAITHAWFAGFAPADHPQIVVVVYVEQGRGGLEAAAIAHRIFEAWEKGGR